MSSTIEDHLLLARHNLTCYQNDEHDLRWRVSMLFYSALHQVSAAALYKGEAVRRHADRGGWLMKQNSKVYARYEQLRSASEEARYMPGRFPYTADQVGVGGYLYRQKYQVISDWSCGVCGVDPILIPPAAV